MRFLAIAPVLAVAFAIGLTADTAAAAPSGIPDTNLDIDLKQADVKNVFSVLSKVAKRDIVLDECVQGTIDLRLKNTPLPLVFDALALKLHLAYEDDSGNIRVICKDSEAGSTEAVRISVSEKDAALPEALARLATAAKLDGVDYRATAKPHVDMTLNRVRLGTALTALSESSGVKLKVSKKRLVVTD